MTHKHRVSGEDWHPYRGHEIRLFYHHNAWAGLARCNGELIAYCEAPGNGFAQQQLRKVIDERMHSVQRYALTACATPSLNTAVAQALTQLDAPSCTLLRLHTLNQNGGVPIDTARRWSGLDSGVDVILRYAQFARLIYDALQAQPPDTDDGQDPYLSSLLLRRESPHAATVLQLLPAVYCALQLSQQDTPYADGHRTTQNLSGGEKYPPLR